MSVRPGARRLIPAFAALLGLGLLTNGLFMLAVPENWYFAVPGVTTTGPFNQHFLRDIGLIFVLVGGGFIVGAINPAMRPPLWSAGAIWLAGHALFHVWEVAVGICGPSALARDFPAVSLPAIIAASFALWSIADRRAGSAEG